MNIAVIDRLLAFRLPRCWWRQKCLSVLQASEVAKFYLHDTVYLYLRTVNQTLAEGYSAYRDGRYILKKAIGQQFVGRLSAASFLFL